MANIAPGFPTCLLETYVASSFYSRGYFIPPRMIYCVALRTPPVYYNPTEADIAPTPTIPVCTPL
jgi:hypothetical protein